MRTTFCLRRLTGAAAAAAGLVLVTALPAAAHVTVSSPDAEPGGFGKLVFRVPNESDTANTTRFLVRLPTDTPLASVSAKPVPGWTVEAEPTQLDRPAEMHGTTITEAVTTVTWTAEEGGGLLPDQFLEFEVSAGPLPEDVDALTFPAIQTYSDGEVARWVEQPEKGAPEPESPAPVLELTATGDAAGHDAGTAAAGADAVEPASAIKAAGDTGEAGTDSLARGLGGVAIVLGAAALVWSLLLPRRTRR